MEQLLTAIAWEWAYQFWLEDRRIIRGEYDTPSRKTFVEWCNALNKGQPRGANLF